MVPLAESVFHKEVPVECARAPRSDMCQPSPSRLSHGVSRFRREGLKNAALNVPGFGPTAQHLKSGGILVSFSRFFPSLHLTFQASTWRKRMFSRALVTLFSQTAQSTQLAWSVTQTPAVFANRELTAIRISADQQHSSQLRQQDNVGRRDYPSHAKPEQSIHGPH